MTIHESAEDYLEQILMLLEKKGHARSIDIANERNVSKPSVSIAMKKLRENGYIKMGMDNMIALTRADGETMVLYCWEEDFVSLLDTGQMLYLVVNPGLTEAVSTAVENLP